jgi:hypothetical protein
VSLLLNRPPGETTPNCPGSLFDDNENDGTFVKASTDIIFSTFVKKA